MAPPASAPAPTAAVSDAASTSPATPPARTASPPAPLPLSTEVVVLKQDMPPLPFALANSGKQEYSGLVEVQIDVTGRVSDVRILQSVHALYDPMLLKAAREWLYEPLRVAGKPTASRKRVQVVLRP
jgi:TonB family protein